MKSNFKYWKRCKLLSHYERGEHCKEVVGLGSILSSVLQIKFKIHTLIDALFSFVYVQTGGANKIQYRNKFKLHWEEEHGKL